MAGLLLEHGTSLTVRSDRGLTPLHIAVRAGDTRIATMLLSAGVDPEVDSGPDNYRGMPFERENPWTPADRAFASGSIDLAMLFSERMHSPEKLAQAFHRAVFGQNKRVISRMLKHPMLDVNTKVKNSTALYKACERRDINSIEFLLEAGADPNILHKDLENTDDYRHKLFSPFEEPVLSDVKIGPTIAAEGDVGKNILHALTGERSLHPGRPQGQAEEEKLKRCFGILLEYGADVYQVDAKGCTPFHFAHEAVSFHTLLQCGANPNVANERGETLLHTSFVQEILEILIPKADLNRKTTITKRTPLLYAMVEGHARDELRIQKAFQLLHHGADVTTVDYNGNSVLHLAVGIHDRDEVGLSLLKQLCSGGVDINQQNHQGKTPLHMSGPGAGRRNVFGRSHENFDPRVFQILMAAGADLNVKDSQGQTPLFQFIQDEGPLSDRELRNIFTRMAEAGSKVNTLDSRGRTLLHAIVSRRHIAVEFLEFLVAQGFSPKATDYEGNTLFHEVAPQLAKNHRSIEAIKRLVDMEVDPVKPNCLGRTPLHILSSFRPEAFDPCSSFNGSTSRPSNADDPTIFDHFLNLQVDTDYGDVHGITPLHLASTFSEYMVRRLLEAGANPSKATYEGLTPFHLAARSRQSNVIGILLDRLKSNSALDKVIATLNVKDKMNRTALYYAAASGRVESVQLLIGAAATMNHDMYIGSPWNGCADFEEEQTNADWSRQTENDLRYKRDRSSRETDAGGVMISDTARPEKVLRYHNEGPPFLTERLEEIVDLLAAHTPTQVTGFIDQAIKSAVERKLDYTAKCLLRIRDVFSMDTQFEIDEDTRIRFGRQQDAHFALASAQGPEKMNKLMQLREYALVHDKLTVTDCVKHENWRGDSTFLHQLVLGGFTSLVSEAATSKNIAETEWYAGEDKDYRKSVFSRLHVHPLLIAAGQRELPSMDVIRVLLEDKRVDVIARMAVRSSRNRSIPNGPAALHYLAAGSHWWQAAEAIPYLVKHHGADMELKNSTGRTPLGYAMQAINGPHFSKRTVEILLNLGADPNEGELRGASYLSMAVPHKEIFELLVQNGAIITQPTLIAVINRQDVDLLQRILAAGADRNMRKVGKEVPEQHFPNDSYTMARHDPNSTDELYALDYIATETERKDIGDGIAESMLRMLLDHGADPFACYQRTTVLHRVIQNRGLHNTYKIGQNRCLNIFLELPNLDLETRDSYGMTLLLLACSNRFCSSDHASLEIMQKLLSLGADILVRDYRGRSAIHHLCESKRLFDTQDGNSSMADVASIATKAPELVNAIDNEGKTPCIIPLSVAMKLLLFWLR